MYQHDLIFFNVGTMYTYNSIGAQSWCLLLRHTARCVYTWLRYHSYSETRVGNNA